LFGYEFKFAETKKASAPKGWLDTYSNAEFAFVNRNNYLDFIS